MAQLAIQESPVAPAPRARLVSQVFPVLQGVAESLDHWELQDPPVKQVPQVHLEHLGSLGRLETVVQLDPKAAPDHRDSLDSREKQDLVE